VNSWLGWGFALPWNVVADGSVDRKSSGNLISYAPTRPKGFNKVQAEKPYIPLIVGGDSRRTACKVFEELPCEILTSLCNRGLLRQQTMVVLVADHTSHFPFIALVLP
jgi:hypothetical protein